LVIEDIILVKVIEEEFKSREGCNSENIDTVPFEKSPHSLFLSHEIE